MQTKECLLRYEAMFPSKDGIMSPPFSFAPNPLISKFILKNTFLQH